MKIASRLGSAIAGGIVAGLALGMGMTAATSTAEAQDRVRWKMGSTYPGTLTQLGTLGKRISDKIEEVSGGNIRIRFYEPGALVPALEVFDAVGAGSIDAAWSTPATGSARNRLSPCSAPSPSARDPVNTWRGSISAAARSCLTKSMPGTASNR